MTAKDIAFEKERTKFRKERNELQRIISKKDKEIEDLKLKLSEKETEILSKEEWIREIFKL